MKYLAILMLLGAIGCAGQNHNNTVDVPAEFQVFVQNWQYEATKHAHSGQIWDLIVQFGPMEDPDEAAYCQLGQESTPTIVIDEVYWHSIDYYAKELLMFHELGHCLLEYNHINTLDANGMPNSIMNWQLFSSSYYETYRELYLQNYFGHVSLY